MINPYSSNHPVLCFNVLKTPSWLIKEFTLFLISVVFLHNETYEKQAYSFNISFPQWYQTKLLLSLETSSMSVGNLKGCSMLKKMHMMWHKSFSLLDLRSELAHVWHCFFKLWFRIAIIPELLKMYKSCTSLSHGFWLIFFC